MTSNDDTTSSSPYDTPIARRLASVKHIIVVMSGKGGVGKSSSAVQLALSLLDQSPTTTVGMLDLDLTGPSLPRMLGLDGRAVHQSSSGWVPVYADAQRRLGCMSVGFLLSHRGESVVWRGPKKDGMIRQFLAETRWGDLDYLVIDTPPGTSDEHISLLTHLHPMFLPDDQVVGSSKRRRRTPPEYSPTPTAVLISTPQATALNDALKSLSFARKLNLPVLGLVENMAGYACPCCHEISHVFSKGGGEKLASEQGLGFLGKVPIDTKLVALLDAVAKGDVPVGADVSNAADAEAKSAATTSFPLLDRYRETTSAMIWHGIAEDVVRRIMDRGKLAVKELEERRQAVAAE